MASLQSQKITLLTAYAYFSLVGKQDAWEREMSSIDVAGALKMQRLEQMKYAEAKAKEDDEREQYVDLLRDLENQRRALANRKGKKTDDEETLLLELESKIMEYRGQLDRRPSSAQSDGSSQSQQTAASTEQSDSSSKVARPLLALLKEEGSRLEDDVQKFILLHTDPMVAKSFIKESDAEKEYCLMLRNFIRTKKEQERTGKEFSTVSLVTAKNVTDCNFGKKGMYESLKLKNGEVSHKDLMTFTMNFFFTKTELDNARFK